MGGVVIPVRPTGRRVAVLLAFALPLSLALVAPAGAQDGGAPDLGVPVDAAAPATGKITRVLTIGVIEDGQGECPGAAPAPCWDVSTLAANPGDVVVLHANLLNSDIPHNLHVIEPGSDPVPASPGSKSRTSGAAVHTVSIEMPTEGKLSFICDVHPQTMVGTIVTPQAAAAAGGGHAAVPTLGVHFLAYWVGVIAFAILFVVYGATFLLFKYNETTATTDHWDRGEAGGSKRLAAIAPLAAAVLGLVGMAAIVFVVTR